MVSRNTSFLISKDPHSIGTPYSKKSRDSWLKKVVFPDPVAPVTSENSPILSPCTYLLKKFKLLEGIPANIFSLFILNSSCLRISLTLITFESVKVSEQRINSKTSVPLIRASLASFGPSGSIFLLSTIRHLFWPNFYTQLQNMIKLAKYLNIRMKTTYLCKFLSGSSSRLISIHP